MVVSSISIQREKTAAGFTQGHSYARFLKILFKVINLILVALSQSASTTMAFASSLKRWKILPDGLLCIYSCLKQNSEPQGKVHLSDSQNKSACIAIHRGAAGEKLAPERHQMVGVELTREPPDRCWRKWTEMWVPGLGTRRVIQGVHIHACPKRERTASFEHIVCVENSPRKMMSPWQLARGPHICLRVLTQVYYL